jgi:hypothetical protein
MSLGRPGERRGLPNFDMNVAVPYHLEQRRLESIDLGQRALLVRGDVVRRTFRRSFVRIP